MKLFATFAIFVITCLALIRGDNRNFKCGVQRTVLGNKLFGAEEFNSKEDLDFPWVVGLHQRKLETFFCAGSLVSDRHVLSAHQCLSCFLKRGSSLIYQIHPNLAAHCFQNKGNIEKYEPYEVWAMLGRFNVSDHNEPDSTNSLVYDIKIHPDWDFNSDKYDADIAIVILQDAVQFGKFIQPVCLPPARQQPLTGTGRVIGWGKSEKPTLHDETPSHVEIPAVEGVFCLTKYPKLAIHASIRVFCGGFENKATAPCFGDSGGGFYLENRSKRQWEVAGLVSGSQVDSLGRCEIDQFSLYTNIGTLVDWVKKEMSLTKRSVWEITDFQCENIVVVKHKLMPIMKCMTPENQRYFMKIRLDNFSQEELNNVNNFELRYKFDLIRLVQGIGEKLRNLKNFRISFANSQRSPEGGFLTSIERSDFANMKNLQILDLRSNKIGFLADDAFQDLTNLEEVILEQCRIERLPKNLFSSLHKLKNLRLGNNNLRVFPEEIFAKLRNLQYLDLNSNEIRNIPRSLMANNLQLRTINFNNNRLKKILFDFTRMSNLQALDLSGNVCVEKFFNKDYGDIQRIQDLQEIINRDCN